MNSQTRGFHGACVSLCAIHCRRLKIALGYYESTFIDPHLIPTLLSLRRTFTKLEEAIAPALCPSRFHLPSQFIETNQLK